MGFFDNMLGEKRFPKPKSPEYEVLWDEIYTVPEIEIELRKNNDVIYKEKFELDPCDDISYEEIYAHNKRKVLERIKYIKEHVSEFEKEYNERQEKMKSVDDFEKEVLDMPFGG